MYLDQKKLPEISKYLQTHGILKSHEFVSSAEKAGEGNMNFTLRLFVDEKTFIIKQARPFVEKYPTIKAPEKRILVETEFYKIIANNSLLNQRVPQILFSDAENHILLLQDLGKASDYNNLYQKGEIFGDEDAKTCAQFLSNLHQNFTTEEAKNPLMRNQELKALNHEHLFVYPFLEDNGFNLNQITPGLQELAIQYKTNQQLKQKIDALGEIYLAQGSTLLHGDYYPGSWLKTDKGLMVIDPEFAFYGNPEFDFAVLNAHLYLGKQNEKIFNIIKENYQKSVNFDETLFRQFTGIEIMRRIIGLAQLPLSLDLTAKKTLLEDASEMIMA